jgi:hypothetical protein
VYHRQVFHNMHTARITYLSVNRFISFHPMHVQVIHNHCVPSKNLHFCKCGQFDDIFWSLNAHCPMDMYTRNHTKAIKTAKGLNFVNIILISV